MDRVRVGVIGCGHISDHYFRGCGLFDILDMRACADMDMTRAHRLAEAHGVRALTVEQLLADPEIEVVVNLTPPAAHAEVALAVIAAGKHVHNEKPLAQTRAQGQVYSGGCRRRRRTRGLRTRYLPRRWPANLSQAA